MHNIRRPADNPLDPINAPIGRSTAASVAEPPAGRTAVRPGRGRKAAEAGGEAQPKRQPGYDAIVVLSAVYAALGLLSVAVAFFIAAEGKVIDAVAVGCGGLVTLSIGAALSILREIARNTWRG